MNLDHLSCTAHPHRPHCLLLKIEGKQIKFDDIPKKFKIMWGKHNDFRSKHQDLFKLLLIFLPGTSRKKHNDSSASRKFMGQ